MLSDKPATSYDINKLERQISALESKIYSLTLEIKEAKREVESFSSKFKDWLWKKELNSDYNWLIWSIAMWLVAIFLFLIAEKHHDNKPQHTQPNISAEQKMNSTHELK